MKRLVSLLAIAVFCLALSVPAFAGVLLSEQQINGVLLSEGKTVTKNGVLLSEGKTVTKNGVLLSEVAIILAQLLGGRG